MDGQPAQRIWHPINVTRSAATFVQNFFGCGWNDFGLRCVYSAMELRARSSTQPPVMPGGQIVVNPPPELPKPPAVSPLARLMPVAMIAAMAGMGALYLTSGSASARNPMFLFFPAMMLVSVVGTLLHGARGSGRAAEVNDRRAEYLRYLEALDAALARCANEQQVALHWIHPDPRALWTLAGGDRMWERTPDHPQFCSVRVGLGEQPSATAVVAPELAPDDDADPVTNGAVRRLVDCRTLVGRVPVALPVGAAGAVTVAGDHRAARAVVRALVCQLAMLHHPALIGIDAQPGMASHDAWDWVKWLPHHSDYGSEQHRVLIIEGSDGPSPADGVTIIQIRAESPGSPVTVRAGSGDLTVECDELTVPEALACARRMARYRPAPETGRHQGPADWPALMEIENPEQIDADRLWAARKGSAVLRVPIGVTEDGTVVHLDIKEAAAGGMGPHGLCVGATGSGKSEFLRTLTLGMIAAHSPETLNLVLVDFKGGATFLGLEDARHVSAVITNLADEAQLVSRMREALSGEVHRRQEMLRAAGNCTNIAEYGRARVRDRTLRAMPALFIIVDEFSELLSQHPDFAEVFVAIGRLGRSLGIHLLLASQRLDEGRLRGLETHLSYRVCLKTFSASESRAVLGVADSYHLPTEPGAAYLKTAAGAVTRFQTAFVSGGYAPRLQGSESAEPPVVEIFTAATAARPASSARQPETPIQRSSLLDTVLRMLADRGPAAHRVWLPPLGRPPRLEALLRAETTAHLRVPIGLVDCPFEQRHERHIIDLSGAAGNIAVVGAPRSGKSTTLRTVVVALAATHDPDTVQFYCLDFGGGALAALAELPHVGSVAGRREVDLCRRTVAVLESVLRQRESAFRCLGVDCFADYRRVRDAGHDPYGDVFLVIDGWATVRQEFDGLEAPITALAAQGLSYGIHVMIGAARWAELRPALKDQIGTRIELRLGDPADSEMDRRRARDLADHPPGRGVTREGREMAIALADLDLARRRGGCAAPPVELLPGRVDHHAVIARSAPRHADGVLLGLGERDLTPVALDFTEHPHLLVLGAGECGKTALLRLLCAEITRTRSPREAQLEIVDFRRTMLGVVESDHLAGYSVSGVALASRMSALTERLHARMPDEHVSQQQLRNRSWWDGPDIYVVVDDYDLVAGATGNPLTPIADFLPHAKDLGLHIVVARRSGGAARAMFDPVLARLRDMGCSGLMMSAGPEEPGSRGEFHPPAPTESGREPLGSSGSCRLLT